MRGRGEAASWHGDVLKGVRMPSLYLSIYRGREEGVAPLGFPLGGRRPGQMGSPLG